MENRASTLFAGTHRLWGEFCGNNGTSRIICQKFIISHQALYTSLSIRSISLAISGGKQRSRWNQRGRLNELLSANAIGWLRGRITWKQRVFSRLLPQYEGKKVKKCTPSSWRRRLGRSRIYGTCSENYPRTKCRGAVTKLRVKSCNWECDSSKLN
jgi:hypothetical protein